jgi:hypothetical protein
VQPGTQIPRRPLHDLLEGQDGHEARRGLAPRGIARRLTPDQSGSGTDQIN